MAVWDKKILWAVMLVLTGALGQRVNYPDPVCGIKGSTVTLPCSFTPLESVDDNGREVLIKIIRVVWCKNHKFCQGHTPSVTIPSVYDSSSNNNNNPRYRYLGDKNENCTLQISDLQKEDNSTFHFRMEANDPRASFTGQSGVRVTVDQMKIRSSRDDGEFKRGEEVTLNCTAAICSIHQLEVIWFRDGSALSESDPTLHLSYLTAKDSGNYTCGLKKNKRTLSEPYSLHVEADQEGALGQRVNYPDPVCGIKGSTVTLPCSFTPLESVYDDGREVVEIIRVVWCTKHVFCLGSTLSVFDSSSIQKDSRYRYLGDKKGDCTLQISDLQEEDNTTFYFRMEANYHKAHFTGRSGVRVRVEDGIKMKIRSSRDDGEFKRGDTITLNCTTNCTIHQLEVTWFRDGSAFTETGPTLHLSYLTAKDSGNYTCGLKENNRTLSVPYSLHVEADEEGGGYPGGGGGGLRLIVGLVVGVRLVLFTVILVVYIIKRKRAAGRDQTAVGRDEEQQHYDNIYSNDFLPLAEQQGPSSAVEEVSYASVQFTHKKQARPAEEMEDSIIYSAVA